MISQSELPIGIFDSGMGGLTVLKAIISRMEHENLLYLGDTARLPYGTKSRETIGRYAGQAAEKLVSRGIKMLVIACNTATAAALPQLRAAFAPLPVIGVVEPGARAAVKATRNGNIAVIATEATITGGAYQQAIHALRPSVRVVGRPCTLFVPLAEEGWTEGPLVEAICSRYLDDIFEDNDNAPDTLMLGCTHYPLLKKALRNVVGPSVTIVDSAATTAEAVKRALQEHSLARGGSTPGEKQFLTTDNPARFARTGSLFLGTKLKTGEVELVDL